MELIQAIEDCMLGLAPEFRTVAVLVDVQGFDYQEVVETIGKPSRHGEEPASTCPSQASRMFEKTWGTLTLVDSSSY